MLPGKTRFHRLDGFMERRSIRLPQNRKTNDIDELQRIVSRQHSGDGFKGPQPISEILSRLMTRRGYGNLQISHEWADAWSQTAGPQAKNTRTGKFSRGVLEVIVQNSTLLQELTFRKKHLLQAMQQRLPQAQIKDLRFRVGEIG
jgi:predicted nucleic acid-binding Zn ribbon protein